MRLLRITTNYTNYLKQFYNTRPELKQHPYATQYQTLAADGFGWADFWTHALKPFGYESWELVANAKPMQTAWAREHGIRYDSQTWITDIIAAQVKFFQPEILFADDSAAFTPNFLRRLRQQCPSIKLILGWCAPPDFQRADTAYAAHDIVLSNEPVIVSYFRQQHRRAEYVKHAFEPRMLSQSDLVQPDNTQFSFVGSLFSGAFHQERDQMIRILLEQTPLEIWSNVYDLLLPHNQAILTMFRWIKRFPSIDTLTAKTPFLRRYNVLRTQTEISFYARSHIIPKIHASVFGRQMFGTLRQSLATLNHHGDLRWNSACNMRLFEATGMGTCLLTDWKANLSELFEPDSEVVTYRSVEECQEKAKWLLNHPAKAAEIARAGQSRTLREHTFAHRAEQLHSIILKNI
ncbi:hypothetical protein U14_02959 [Candidatus Moduliflexus flocculans]|uniref:Spore protein YkvP/CgeB glycosyl transferase-like domain-containing protein n=1 Tax=Candidatus Moduliflexus flocculans TaxID=1499966 RepID=A0A081BMU8_9BACT|nr:hypothetical protein U14_02959 [Candidatus Moduliflexus flocculans]